MLEVRLLGSGSAQVDGRRLPGFPNQLPYLLFCYLLLNRGQACRREQLAALFWPDVPTPVSLKHLRNALWRLRHLLETAGVSFDAYVDVSEGLVTLRPASAASPYWLDIEVFEQVTTAWQTVPGPNLSLEQVAQLQDAVDLYAGDLLQGLYQDWCLYDRERFYLLYLNTLSKLLAFHEAHGNCERGLEVGRRILACDNTRESTHRQMMRLYWQAGDRSAALMQYRSCAQALRNSLNAVPMAATELLYQQILANELPPASSRPGTPPPGPARPAGHRPVLQDAVAALDRLHATLAGVSDELLRISQLIDAIQTGQDAPAPDERQA